MTPEADRPYLAAFLDVRGRAALVVGGGEIAARRAATLLRSGMRVTIVAPALGEALSEWARAGAVAHKARRFEAADVEGAELVIAATDDAAVNAGVAAAAKARRIAVNVVDDPSLSTLIMPALVDRAPIRIAISTEGASPALARRLGALIDEAIPAGFERIAALAAKYRAASIRRWPEPRERARFWERILDGPIVALVAEGREDAAEALLRRELES